MKRYILLTAFFSLFCVYQILAQDDFKFKISLNPIEIKDLQGLHSYAFAQHEGKWLIIGGRRDGIHARQPFNAFPESKNNTDIYVVDIAKKTFVSSSINILPTALKEQLQATNMNFEQDKDTLYFAGGYAFAASKNDHITFPSLIAIQVSDLIEAIEKQKDITPFFKQIFDDKFAITGGQMAKMGDFFYLIGGHRFDGRYNPMENPTYVQTYSNQIRKFKLNNTLTNLSFSNDEAITDEVHLRRRDYNLIPQIFADGSEGYMISSGVFQKFEDLPFLYPVEIKENGYFPNTSFNQYLSNYHTANASIYDSISKATHTIFFGGISQYYYENGKLVKDDNVPFVKTISSLTRKKDGTLKEWQLPFEMPNLQGASAEFIPNLQLPHFESEMIKIAETQGNKVVLGHIFGGIHSTSRHPFSNNQPNQTQASNVIYEVILEKENMITAIEIDGKNPFSCQVFPNPSKGEIFLNFDLPYIGDVFYFLSTANGVIIDERDIEKVKLSANKHKISLKKEMTAQILYLTLVFDNKFYQTHKIVLEK